jgi:hypothetical protein
MRRLIACLALALPLMPAAQAAAKELVSAKVCGASDCREVEDRSLLAALADGGPPTPPPAKASAWFRVDLTMRGDGEDFTFSIAIVPDAGLIRGQSEDGTYYWMSASEDAARTVRETTRGIEAFPAAKLGGLDAPDPSKAQVSEVVVIGPPEAASDGRSSTLPWVLGGLVAAASLTAAATVFARRRRRGLPPHPASGPASG